MTLLLALANESYSLVLGDRRLSRNGVICEDESNKLCVLFCNDARVAFAYTGVAEYGKLRTQDWLRDTLAAVGERKHALDEILAELQSEASAAYAPLPVAQRHIAFLVSGYRYSETGAEHVCCLLSNFDPNASPLVAGRTLEIYELGGPGNVVVEAAGFKGVLTEKDYASLRKMLEANNAAPEVLHKAVEIVQRVSKEAASRRMIGSQCNSAVVLPAVDTKIVTTYHSARPVSLVPGPDVVVAINGGVTASTGMKFGVEGAILAGPDIRKNQYCYCGSGKKFGACHRKKYGSTYARVPGLRRPMSMVLAVSRKEPVPSGRAFWVFSSFD